MADQPSTPQLVAGVALALALAVYLTAGLWGPGMVSGEDTLPHLLQARLAQELLTHRQLDGWQPTIGLGYQQFLFLGPGVSWLVVAVHWLSFGLVSIAGAFKVVAIGSFVTLPLGVAFLASSFGLDRRASGMAAILSLIVSSPFGGVGLTGSFGHGLVAHQVGAVFFLAVLGGSLRVIVDRRRRWVVFTAVAFGLLCITHAISAVVLGAFLLTIVPTLLATERPSVQSLARLGVAFVLGAALVGFWLVPAFAHRDLRGVLSSWESPPLAKRLADILSGQLLFPGRFTIWLLFAGWLFCLHLYQERRRWALALLVCPFAYLWLADALLRWNSQNVVSMQLANRGLGYVGLIAVLPFAALLGHLLGHRRLVLLVSGVLLASFAAFTVAAAAVAERPSARAQIPTRQLQGLARQLALHVPPGARFVAQGGDFAAEQSLSGMSSPAFWLAWASQRNTSNIFNIESSPLSGEAPYEAGEMTRQPPDEAANKLARIGVSHVAIINEATAGPMLTSPRFRLLWHEAPMALLAVVPPAGQPDPGALVTAAVPIGARMVHWQSQRLQVSVVSGAPARATLAIGWSPKWHASIGHRPVPLGRTADGLLTVDLPAGTSTLVLRFEHDGWDRLGALVSMLTAGGLLAWRWRSRHRRSAPALAGPAGEASQEPHAARQLARGPGR